ncbi:uncharacterized protein LOC115966267 isoform X2 [Quercus lobata]|uniref:uncharacterized protein LOC115966267 isoform X2 n=1 Tax=Quercus lobata TaxID=97700 RepID=UPI001245593B|nr:uncharacterized protein LOC115966267 isoform X2 [Quercus lobata]
MEGQGVLEKIGELKKQLFEIENQHITALTPEAPTGSRRLEIAVKNGKKLQNVHRTHSLKAYPVVYIGYEDGEIVDELKPKKPADPVDGSNPVWDAKFTRDFDEAGQERLYLFVRVESNRKIRSGSKFVGEFSVAIKDLLKDFGDAVDKKSVRQDIMNKKGEAHGKVTFEYKFTGTLDPQPADPPLPQEDSPQPANGRHDSNRHSFLRAFAGKVVRTLVGELLNIVVGRILN